MGLENLKSVFSDIKKFGKVSDVRDAENMSTLAGASGDSIEFEPQAVDNLVNFHTPGFITNQVNQSPNSLFWGVDNKTMTWDNTS